MLIVEIAVNRRSPGAKKSELSHCRVVHFYLLHLEGVMNGTLLIAVGAAWTEVRLSPSLKAAAFWSALYGTYLNWGITTLAAMDQGLEVYSPTRIHNYHLLRRAIERLWGELLPRTHAERRTLAGLEPGREDVILAGTLILLEVMERFGFSECLVSDYGLREGVLIDLWRKTAQ